MTQIDHFSAIINPPQSVILAVSRAAKTPVFDENAPNNLTWATMMNVCLSCDHRVVDGVDATNWLSAFKKACESPLTLLL